MKLHEADKISQFIMTDDWQKINGQYDYSENGMYFVIEFDYANRRVHVHGKELYSYFWKGTKDSMTQHFRGWLHKTVNDELAKMGEKKEV